MQRCITNQMGILILWRATEKLSNYRQIFQFVVAPSKDMHFPILQNTYELFSLTKYTLPCKLFTLMAKQIGIREHTLTEICVICQIFTFFCLLYAFYVANFVQHTRLVNNVYNLFFCLFLSICQLHKLELTNGQTRIAK